MAPAALLALAFLLSGASASPSAVALQPSSQWYGIDGNWSAISLTVGDPGQTVNVLVGTVLSELWVVQSGGCLNREPLCDAARGNVFTIGASTSWKPLGAWDLGLAYLGYGGHGDYGLDSVQADTINTARFSMGNVLTAAFNTTDYYNGLFGLGIVQGRFGDQTHESPLTQAVMQYGQIPSYSYGYTAGAYYAAGSSGIPCSLTLGGYDESRFVPHDTEFSLAQNGTTPRLLVRHIVASTAEDARPPLGWQSTTMTLSNMSTRFEAIVDSSTPFLWLPDTVCDAFAEALGLTYNSTFDTYTINNNTQFDTFLGGIFSFTFSLSSFDNTDDFGDPLSVPGVVNITVTSSAFAQVLRYPFQDDAIPYGDPSVPYFPIRRASRTGNNSDSTFIIGRTFLQEAYIITKYDSGVFSIHQTQNPEDPANDLAIRAIEQPNNSPFPPPAGNADGTKNLSTGQIVGICVGVGIVIVVAVIALWLVCIRRRRQAGTTEEQEKDASSTSVHSDEARTPVARIISRIVGRRRSGTKHPHEVPGSHAQPTEVGADAGHAVYELAAPLGATEMDAAQDGDSVNGETEFGTNDSQSLTAYEVARRKLAMQLQGPVPPYTPSDAQEHPLSPEKCEARTDSPTAYMAADGQSMSAVSSPTTTFGNSNSFAGSLPSPLSPRGNSTMKIPDDCPSLRSTHDAQSDIIRRSGSNTRSGSPDQLPLPMPSGQSHHPSTNTEHLQHCEDHMQLPAPAARVQRTLIDPSKVKYLGPLPEDLLVERNDSSRPRWGNPLGQDSDDLGGQPSESLGSTHTALENHIIGAAGHNVSQQGHSDPRTLSTAPRDSVTQSARHQQRLGSGSELIHVPQVAERRFSWEDER